MTTIPTYTTREIDGVTVIDLRKRGTYPRYETGAKKGKRRAYRTLRSPDTIDAVCVHHLGPHAGAAPRKGQGETILDRAVWRALRQPYTVWCQPGIVVLVWPFERVTWHGNGFNRRSLGLVVAGNFPALEADREDRHDDPQPCASSVRVALGILHAEVPSVRLLLTHSQAARKPADPGEAVAKIITAAGAALVPPLLPAPELVIGNGRPWAAEWRTSQSQVPQ
jgi:hypothetical protein